MPTDIHNADPSEEAEKQQRLEEPNVAERTKALYQLVEDRRSIELDALRCCVLQSADVTLVPEGQVRSTLQRCIVIGNVEAVKVLLETQRDVDFTATDTLGNPCTALHYVAGCELSSDVKKAMLAAVLERLATHPNDRVDWGQKDGNGLDFLGWAANFYVLSDLYPMVKHLPYYMNAAKPIMLTKRAREDDWVGLSESDRKELKRPRR